MHKDESLLPKATSFKVEVSIVKLKYKSPGNEHVAADSSGK
jgi:hypothetical protein